MIYRQRLIALAVLVPVSLLAGGCASGSSNSAEATTATPTSVVNVPTVPVKAFGQAFTWIGGDIITVTPHRETVPNPGSPGTIPAIIVDITIHNSGTIAVTGLDYLIQANINGIAANPSYNASVPDGQNQVILPNESLTFQKVYTPNAPGPVKFQIQASGTMTGPVNALVVFEGSV